MTQLTQGSDMKEEKSLLAKLFDPTVMLDEQVKLLHQYKQRSIDRAIIEAREDELAVLAQHFANQPFDAQATIYAQNRIAELEQQLSPTTTTEEKESIDAPVYRRRTVLNLFHERCGKFLRGNGSAVMPYECDCGKWYQLSINEWRLL